jgi:predicted DNA-binding transcriptional regulator AlpA
VFSEVMFMQETTENVLKVDAEASRLLRDFFTEEQLALELEIGRRSLYRWHRQGRGPQRTKLGKRVLYKRSAVEAWLSTLSSRDHKTLRQSRTGVRAQAQREKAIHARKT